MVDDEQVPWSGRTQLVLEAGGWWEVLPSDLHHFESHARAYVASTKVDPEAKERVRAVWLKHEYRPAWQKHSPVKGGLPKRGEVDEDPF